MIVKYIEPDDNEEKGFREVFITKQDAIKQQIRLVSIHHPNFHYESEEQAFLDFCVNHWAEVVDK